MGSGRARSAPSSAGHRPRREATWEGSALLNTTAQDDLCLLLSVGACLHCPCRTLQLPPLFSVPALWSHKPQWNFGWKH